MDSSFNLFTGAIIMVIGLIMAGAAWTFFCRFKNLSSALNRAHEMTQTANGSISELVAVRRRNRSFRWTNEYPVVSFPANGKQYNVQLSFAEKRAGHYTLGSGCRVCYVPHDPQCCVVEEFRKPMQRARTQYLIWTIVLCFFTLNCITGGIGAFLTAFIG